ncbi:hypothetical protein F751_6329 [Auxenochlorella protothecoides]|uniref:HAD family hydrolase n=1 Tax=Auxenochlorella protothecoides TaxID=3075 RepID=A0A087SSV4_AUXPR|nr:hypothetical protein F751_6329 [Auxenochlorella protothecoides]KFM28808.1 hypothetical protein F751_6329 [Auxenochlorella protothecoides]
MPRLQVQAQRQVWALDFDGVVCDSVGESAIAAWKASAQYWPEMFARPEVVARRQEIIDQLKVVRPVVETGYENLVLVRCLLAGVDPQAILKDWHKLLGEHMQLWGLDRSEVQDLKARGLLAAFGGMRDQMMQEDLAAWIDMNDIYPGVAESVRRLVADHEAYIVTTKQARFAEAILHRLAGVDLPPERIFSQAETGAPKSEILHLLEERHPGTQYHFVEDKALTLHKASAMPQLAHWNLYLVDWGYNTQEEREVVRRQDRIKLISLDDFHALA